ncbi:HprK-related kinase B [Terasakiella pusilla]|uniref:HprK-related kinase B n=1 Tax=Terasakiella pusilla TaxID=64973 RepID=UPI003AA8C698
MITTAQQAAEALIGNAQVNEGRLVLDLDGYKIEVQSNSQELLEQLGRYFAHTLGAGEPDCRIIAIEGPAPDLGLPFVDWKREAGKSGRKDAFYDLTDGRLILKVRTGMVFLQSRDHLIASGPSLANDNQIINYINAQYMNKLQQDEALICHASGLVRDGACLGMAGFSGGGKSTLMLKMLEEQGLSYLTNDRLFLKDGRAIGIPKLPRINPGTILNNETLRPILSDERAAELQALPIEELWHLEEKYDVFVEDVYGEEKITPSAKLGAFLILNWQREGTKPLSIDQVDLSARPELLHKAIMKSPGPFYQYADGSFFADTTDLDPVPYLEALQDVPIYEASGTIDFDAAARFCLKELPW